MRRQSRPDAQERNPPGPPFLGRVCFIPLTKSLLSPPPFEGGEGGRRGRRGSKGGGGRKRNCDRKKLPSLTLPARGAPQTFLLRCLRAFVVNKALGKIHHKGTKKRPGGRHHGIGTQAGMPVLLFSQLHRHSCRCATTKQRPGAPTAKTMAVAYASGSWGGRRRCLRRGRIRCRARSSRGSSARCGAPPGRSETSGRFPSIAKRRWQWRWSLWKWRPPPNGVRRGPWKG